MLEPHLNPHLRKYLRLATLDLMQYEIRFQQLRAVTPVRAASEGVASIPAAS
jgi:hypothetical protein